MAATAPAAKASRQMTRVTDVLLIRVTKGRHIFLQKFFVEPDEAVTLLVFGVLAGITFFILFQGTLL
jgi:hypothetical protein